MKITKDGKVIDAQGRAVPYTQEFGKPKNHPDAHIKKSEWLTWDHPLEPPASEE